MGYNHIVADTPPLRLLEIATSWLQGGNQSFFWRNHDNKDIRDKIYGRGKWDVAHRQGSSVLLCSEFVGMTSVRDKNFISHPRWLVE